MTHKHTLSLLIIGCLSLGLQAQEVVFSDAQPFHDEAFVLSLASSEPGFDVYYTLDGTRPTRANAERYFEPITIDTTTPVSAVCIDANDSIGPIATRTFIFLHDAIKKGEAA